MIEPGDQRLTPQGALCTVATLARDSENEGVVVVYTSGVGAYWVMPLEDFEREPAVPIHPDPRFFVPFAVALGKYRHFKGNVYEAVCRARDPKTLANLIVYESAEGVRWVRTESMWLEEVTGPDGVKCPRFAPELG